MKAAVFRAPKQDLTIEDVDIDKPGPREVLVRTVACGVCHSDLHFVDGLYPYPAPAVLGHEAAGIVEAVGDQVTQFKPGDHVILPDVISKEPLAPVVRQKDDEWLLIVKWTLFAMLNAEELGITSKNIDVALKSKKPDVMRFVGTEGDYGEGLGLTNDWAARIIRRVGNYGEVYDRNIGVGSMLGIPRGLNQLWNAGGILYAPPIR